MISSKTFYLVKNVPVNIIEGGLGDKKAENPCLTVFLQYIVLYIPATEEKEDPIPCNERAKNSKPYVPEKANTAEEPKRALEPISFETTAGYKT